MTAMALLGSRVMLPANAVPLSSFTTKGADADSATAATTEGKALSTGASAVPTSGSLPNNRRLPE